MRTPKEKENTLLKKLKKFKTLAVAYSGGVDSTYLADCANEVLKKDALIVIADSPSLPRSELKSAISFANDKKWNLKIIKTNEYLNKEYLKNEGQRCYHCKNTLFKTINNMKKKYPNIKIAHGAVEDDKADHRPGSIAAIEHDVVAPLQQVGLYKKEIRILSSYRKLPTAEKASFACLGSRFPTGTPINIDALSQVELAEEELRNRGYHQYRIRHHNELCRIEIDPKDFNKILKEKDAITNKLKEIGYRYITLDLNGYQTGSSV